MSKRFRESLSLNSSVNNPEKKAMVDANGQPQIMDDVSMSLLEFENTVLNSTAKLD